MNENDIPMNDSSPLSSSTEGLNPVDLLLQGTVEDSMMDSHNGKLFTPPSPEEIASIFLRFEILELIGIGGMGAVYKVRQKDLDRIVALKILPQEISSDPAFSGQFTREAKALAKLNHPNIVMIHEFGQEQGLYYIIMEYVDGINLRNLMQQGLLSPREALAIVPQICDALQYAHDRGIVHRDIKPENILLDKQGHVKVADFGLVKLAAGNSESQLIYETLLTKDGKVMGTPAYMAPEQFSEPSEVDHRADIYSLGVVFYQMLTGELPSKPITAPSRKIELNVKLDEVVLKALDKDPERRFQQADAMKTKLQEAESKEHSVKKHPWLFISGILAILVIVGAFILFTVSNNYDQDANQPEAFLTNLPDDILINKFIVLTPPDEKLETLENKLHGKISRLSNTNIVFEGKPVQINAITAHNEENAIKILSTLEKEYNKPFPYSLRKENLVIEYYAQTNQGMDFDYFVRLSRKLGLLEEESIEDTALESELLAAKENLDIQKQRFENGITDIFDYLRAKCKFAVLKAKKEKVKGEPEKIEAIYSEKILTWTEERYKAGVGSHEEVTAERSKFEAARKKWYAYFDKHEMPSIYSWLYLVDEGKYKDAYLKLSQSKGTSTNKEEWESNMKAIREPFGKLVSRKFKDLSLQEDGNLYLITFNVEFSDAKKATETVGIKKSSNSPLWSYLEYRIDTM